MSHVEVWERFAAVRSSRISTEGDLGIRTGRGTITTTRPDAVTIEWEESGSWQVADERPTPYHDRLRWRWDASRAVLSLSHLRRGAEHPVHLVDLVPGADGALAPLAPHRCGDDLYCAGVEVGTDMITVRWQVSGPKKGYDLLHTYT